MNDETQDLKEVFSIPVGAFADGVGAPEIVKGIFHDVPLYAAPDRAHILVVMVHGFPGSGVAGTGNIFAELQEELSLYGFRSFSFDFRGCGQSTGLSRDFTLTQAASDLRTVLDWAATKGFTRIILVSEGLGAVLALAERREDIAAQILLWPLLDPGQTKFHGLYDSLDSATTVEKGYTVWKTLDIGVAALREIQACDPRPVLEALEIPLLVQHGERDDIAPIGQLDLLRRHALGAGRIEITSYQDGIHGLPDPQHRQTMFYHIVQFLQKFG